MQGAQHDHRNHPRQEQNDDERVEDAEPLNVCVWHRLENVIPSRAPLDRVVLDEFDAVGVDDVDRFAVFQWRGWDLERRLAVAIEIVRVVTDG